MSEPTRLTVLKALTSEIERRAGLEGCVFRGRDWFGPNNGDTVPFITIMEDYEMRNQDPLQSQDGRARVIDLPLVIIGFDEEDSDNPTDPATRLMYRVMDAIRGVLKDGRLPEGESDILGLGRTVDRIQIGGGTVYPANVDLSSTVAFFSLRASIRFVED
ncbi:hypothetical protein [Paracoccus sanguinis]|nr:hypothetical protein [Paracoccus sanguinis]